MIEKKLEDLLKPVLENQGYDLWGCEYISRGKHALLRIYIDKLEGITIDDCALASRHISACLDVEDPIKAAYTMEVSSPGIPRPLFKLEQYKAYLGEVVNLKLYQPLNGQKKWQGIIDKLTDDTVFIIVNGDALVVPFSSIVKATLAAE